MENNSYTLPFLQNVNFSPEDDYTGEVDFLETSSIINSKCGINEFFERGKNLYNILYNDQIVSLIDKEFPDQLYKKLVIASDQTGIWQFNNSNACPLDLAIIYPEMQFNNTPIGHYSRVNKKWIRTSIEKNENKLEINENSKEILNFSLKKEKNRIESKKYFVIPKNLEDSLSKTINLISCLPIVKSAVEINPNNSFKITLIFSNERVLTLSKDFDSDLDIGDSDNIFYSFFINDNLIAADVENFQFYIKKFKEYIIS